MKTFLHDFQEMRSYLLLWLTQTVSGLDSAVCLLFRGDRHIRNLEE